MCYRNEYLRCGHQRLSPLLNCTAATRQPVDGTSIVGEPADTGFRATNFAGTKMIVTFQRIRGIGSIASADLGIGKEKSIALVFVLQVDVHT